MKKIKENRAITLITLIITIIILLILAGVTIGVLTNTGLFGKANKSVEETKKAQALEDVQLKINEGQLKYNGQLTLKSLTNELIEDKKNNYSVTTESKEDDPDAEKLEDTSDITKDTEAIYVTNEKYGYEVKVSKLLSSSLTNPIQTSSNEESEETGTKKTTKERFADLEAKIEELTTEIGNLKNADNNGNSLSAYPVGSIYMSINNKNPGEIFGGTWETWGTGRVPVSVNTADSNFNTVEKTGGVSSVRLTAAQSGVPAHSHGLNSHTHSIPKLSGSTNNTGAHEHSLGVYSGFHDFVVGGGRGAGWAGYTSSDVTGHWFTETAYAKSAGNHTHTVTTNASTTGAASGPTANNTAANASQDHTNLQPYITCYMWKRTQ